MMVADSHAFTRPIFQPRWLCGLTPKRQTPYSEARNWLLA